MKNKILFFLASFYLLNIVSMEINDSSVFPFETYANCDKATLSALKKAGVFGSKILLKGTAYSARFALDHYFLVGGSILTTMGLVALFNSEYGWATPNMLRADYQEIEQDLSRRLGLLKSTISNNLLIFKNDILSQLREKRISIQSAGQSLSEINTILQGLSDFQGAQSTQFFDNISKKIKDAFKETQSTAEQAFSNVQQNFETKINSIIPLTVSNFVGESNAAIHNIMTQEKESQNLLELVAQKCNKRDEVDNQCLESLNKLLSDLENNSVSTQDLESLSNALDTWFLQNSDEQIVLQPELKNSSLKSLTTFVKNATFDEKKQGAFSALSL